MRVPTVFFLAGILAGASPASPAKPLQHCFSPAQFNGWRSVDAKTLYTRADLNHYYRINLAHECSTLRSPDAQLIFSVHGGGAICSAADMVIQAHKPFGGSPEPCFMKDMTELSPAEVAALPPAQRP